MKTVRVPHGKSFASLLNSMRACLPAMLWVGHKSIRTAWRDCPNAEWMIWLAVMVGVDTKLIVSVASDIAKACLPLYPYGSRRQTRATFKAINEWSRGKSSNKKTLQICRSAVRVGGVGSVAFDTIGPISHVIFGIANTRIEAYYASESVRNSADFLSRLGKEQAVASMVRARIPVELVEEGIGRLKW